MNTSIKNFMKMKSKLVVLFCAVSVMLSMFACSGSGGNDVTKDPKYADVYNQFFFPTQSLYYYDYTNAKGKSGKFLSSQKNAPNTKLIEEITPGKSRLIVTKILEIPNEGKDPVIMVQGRLHRDELSQPLEFMATWSDIKPALRK